MTSKWESKRNKKRIYLGLTLACKKCGKLRWVHKQKIIVPSFTNVCIDCEGKSRLGKNNPNYKNGSGKYFNLHEWIQKQRGTPSFCEGCGTEENRMYHWANISEEYKRDLNDWLRMCVPCHHKFDDTANKVWATRRKNGTEKLNGRRRQMQFV